MAGYVARDGKLPRLQLSFYREDAVLLLIKDPLFPEQVKIGLLGPLHQPPPAGEYAAPGRRQRHGDQEAQRRARLAAVEPGQLLPGALGLSPCSSHLDGPRFRLGPAGPQGLYTPEGGPNVL